MIQLPELKYASTHDDRIRILAILQRVICNTDTVSITVPYAKHLGIEAGKPRFTSVAQFRTSSIVNDLIIWSSKDFIYFKSRLNIEVTLEMIISV